MQINFTGRHVEITPAIKSYATEKLQRLEKRMQNITKINVILAVENLEHIAEATVHVAKHEIYAEAKSSDMYSTLDDLVDKLVTQITKLKEKLSDHHR